jgi:hypothetical protein
MLGMLTAAVLRKFAPLKMYITLKKMLVLAIYTKIQDARGKK